MDELMKSVEEGFESEKMKILALVEEGFESAKRSMLTKIKSYFEDGNRTSTRAKMKLELRNGIAQKIFTGEEIKGDGDAPIEVALVDDATGDVVVDEPEASAKVEFLLLNASQGDDWTAEEFNASIIPQVEGKPPILAGNVAVQLKKGVAVVKNIKIRHHASMIKPAEFKLGARAVGAPVRVKEAKTEAFALKNFRAKYYKKHKNPSLSDEVSRLVCIWRGGKIEERLQRNNIYTVEDFLIQLLINPQHLESIVKSQPKKWKAIVNNAQACLSSERVYCYIDPKQKGVVVFNILGHVLELFPGSYYSQTSTPQPQKEKADAEKAMESAYQNWKEVRAFDDQNSLQQHLASLRPHIDNAAASATVGESSSTTRLNISFCSAASAMSLFGDQTGAVQDFGPFTPGSVGSLFEGVDEYIHGEFGYSRQHDGLTNERNADEGSDAASQVVSQRKRWKILFCVLTFRKRVALDAVCPIRKKRRVG